MGGGPRGGCWSEGVGGGLRGGWWSERVGGGLRGVSRGLRGWVVV